MQHQVVLLQLRQVPLLLGHGGTLQVLVVLGHFVESPLFQAEHFAAVLSVESLEGAQMELVVIVLLGFVAGHEDLLA